MSDLVTIKDVDLARGIETVITHLVVHPGIGALLSEIRARDLLGKPLTKRVKRGTRGRAQAAWRRA